MKLRTELECLTDRDWEPFRGCRAEATKHDAAAAHALLQAIAEWWDRPPKADSCTDASVMWIEQRASEILASWGFGQEKAG
jgi:hypothetical protein